MLSCTPGSVISVLNAWYGRQDIVTCMIYQGYGCKLCSTSCYEDMTQNVAKLANNKTVYTFNVTNAIVGDPCLNTYKYSVINYVCL